MRNRGEFRFTLNQFLRVRNPQPYCTRQMVDVLENDKNIFICECIIEHITSIWLSGALSLCLSTTNEFIISHSWIRLLVGFFYR